MAKVISPIQLRGLLAETTYRLTENGNIAGRKTGPTREKVLTHENFGLTRRNASEFKMAVQDSAALRYALGPALNGMIGSSLNGRMNGLLHLIAQHDPANDLGSRRACNGDFSLLNGFDFNKQLPMKEAWHLKFTNSMDVASGVFSVSIPSFIARKRNVFPDDATHFRIVSGGASIDLVRQHYIRDFKFSELLPLRKKTRDVICFEHQVKVKPGEVLIQVLGVEFYKLVDGREVLVKGSALQVVEAVQRCESSVQSQGDALVREDTNQGDNVQPVKINQGVERRKASEVIKKGLVVRRLKHRRGRVWELTEPAAVSG
jgi:hypothetical protein